MTRALISGTGDLPRLIYEALDPKPYVVALEGFPPKHIPHHRLFRLETLGTLISGLVARGITEVCFAGAIERPPLVASMLDTATMPLVPRIKTALEQGDDAALRAVIGFFEEAGLTVKGAHELVPSLVPAAGVPTAKKPDAHAERDLARAKQVVAAMGEADLGQSCIVCKSQVLAVESVMGTDWMLQVIALFRAANIGVAMTGTNLRFLPGGEALAKFLSSTSGLPVVDAMGLPDAIRFGGVFYKAPKPNQDLRADMPVIGPETLRMVAAAALDGIVVKAGSVMVLDQEATIRLADQLDLFLWFQE
ncbi:MAG: UDP-2,3-diacylglucosamine diphosphatase LpxI [Pseudomonadota bacterium]